ncbi:Non-ribosomal peptide synthetase C-terminal [Jaminaea rosea]|uniref:Non-ribosomal peptide synthetase C-terminal n=1 Tax=Jaminaea rosea TaxID=1569628 RepID=A0A316UPQ1_9BASI|nr:Non-ribosomal peptide synthetase C-terminal [Jaminaea rosea]PWN26758.1 Non-ribosomal peptide synthetase C-terminal [Jaminaea rosea]
MATTFPLDKSRVLTGEGALAVAPAPPSNVNTLPRLFQHQAQAQPQATAFSCQGSDHLQELTYAEADGVARVVAAQLAGLHGGRTSRDEAPTVAIWLEKGISLLLSILATTYSGATLPAGSLQVVEFTELNETSHSTASAAQAEGPRPSDAAYLIYTSGTTGTPKGIAIPHSAALTFALSERAVLETSSDDIVWNGFSPAFDMFVEEMWVTIAGGGHLAIGTREECRDVPGLPAIWTQRGVTVVNAVPTLIGIMGIAQADGDSKLLPACVRLINLGGEACPPALVSKLARPGLRIINTYGPTETTVTATWDELMPSAAVTIGRPLPSYHACLLPISEDSGPVSDFPLELFEGVEGELAIGGPCVGIGYVGRPDLTAQKFIRHPLAPQGCEGERLYRTGDRVRLTAELKIAFLGRIDTQVKHRGFRIELGEIESLLSGHRDVQAAAVILTNPNTDTARLEAFVVTAPGAPQDASSLNALAAEHLPTYMRPEEVHFLEADEMPRLPSGKINAKALHDVAARKAEEAAASKVVAIDETDVTDNDVDPSTPLGILLTTMATVFPSAGRVCPTADFFIDLGGHSLLAAILVSKLRQAKSEGGDAPYASIGLPDIYEARTPLAIAARFSAGDDDACSSEDATVTGEPEDQLLTEGTGPTTGSHWPVSPRNFVLCGIAQVVPLLFLFFLMSLEILVPYLIFDYILHIRGVGWAILVTYGVFVSAPVLLGVVAVIGKWMALGRAKEGEYPLYGVYYFRWWLADRFANLANTKILAESALYPHFLRAMGAKVGSYTHLGAMAIGAAADLVEIGDDVVIGSDVVLMTSVVERGRLILKKVIIESDAIIGSNSVIEGGATLCEGAELGALSMVPDGMRVPAFQRYHGSPARFDREIKEGEAAQGKTSRPSRARAFAMLLGNAFIVVFVLPLLYYMPQIPGLMLFDLVDLSDIGMWGQVAVLSIPIAFAYQIIVYVQLIAFRWLFLGGRLREGTYRVYSTWYLRKWFVDRIMDLALDVLHPVFATLYIVPFLRLLGVKVGRRAEVSTARGLQFELLEIGDESFVADAVLMGDTIVRGNELTLKKTKLESRAFAGNASLLPQGTVLPTGSLVGVLSIAPPLDKPLERDTSCFGSPPVLMPARQKEEGTGDASLLFNPSRGRIAIRLLIEGLRIVLPRAIIIFGLGFSLNIAYTGYHGIGAVYTLLMLPLFYLFMIALPSMLFTIALKWLLIGDYRKKETKWPLWSLNVWLSEAVTSTWETIAEPFLAQLLVGTPYLAWFFRALGVSVGKRVTLLSSDITEYDLVSLGDEAVINQHAGPQTHLFHDRIMQLGTVKLSERAVMKPYSICLPGSEIEASAHLGSLSLLMKGEKLPEGTAWEGAPTRPRSRRKRAPAGAAKMGKSAPSSSSSSTASKRGRPLFELGTLPFTSSKSRTVTTLPMTNVSTAASSLRATSHERYASEGSA